MFDIQKHNFSASADVGYEFDLKLPNGADSGAKLKIIGEMSSVVKAFGRRKYTEFQQRQATAKRKGKELEIDLDEAEETAVEAALIRLVGWSGVTENGKEIPFTKEKAQEVLTEHAWIREAIMNESADVLNFTPKIENK